MKLSTFIKRVKSEFIKTSQEFEWSQYFLCNTSHEVKLDLQKKSNNAKLWLQYEKLYLSTTKEIERRIYPYDTVSAYLHCKGIVNRSDESSAQKVYQYRLGLLDSLILWAKDKES